MDRLSSADSVPLDFAGLMSSRSAKSLTEPARRCSHGRAAPLHKHEAESSQVQSFSPDKCSDHGAVFLVVIGKIVAAVIIHVSAQSHRAIRTPRIRCSGSQSPMRKLSGDFSYRLYLLAPPHQRSLYFGTTQEPSLKVGFPILLSCCQPVQN
jgi:hypothetical protein